MLQHVTYISSKSRVYILLPRFFLPNGGTQANEIKNKMQK